MPDSDLIPFQPPAAPLSALRGAWTFWRNPIETFPRGAYEDKAVRIVTRFYESLLVCDPDMIEQVLIARADQFGRDWVTRRILAPVTGETSIFLAEGAEWRWQRRVVAPAFRHDTLVSFVPVFAAMAARQVERWRNVQGTVDVDAAMSRVTFDIIVETMLGGAAHLHVAAHRRALTLLLQAAKWHGLYAAFSLPRTTPFPGRRRAEHAADYLLREMGRVVAARRAEPSPKPDLLDLLLAARDPETGRGMTDAELVTNLLTFINAGHETTAAALTWTLWLLARDGELQDRLSQEIAAAAGTEPIGVAHLDQLPLCRQALQEAMRLYPPAPAIARQPLCDMEICGERMTKATQVVIPIYAVHRHARLWDDPDKFDVDRFAPERAKARPRCAYLPFGAGPRICIGASFAMLEATVILATLVRAFTFRTLPRRRPYPIARVTLRPRGGMPLVVAPR